MPTPVVLTYKELTPAEVRKLAPGMVAREYFERKRRVIDEFERKFEEMKRRHREEREREAEIIREEEERLRLQEESRMVVMAGFEEEM